MYTDQSVSQSKNNENIEVKEKIKPKTASDVLSTIHITQ